MLVGNRTHLASVSTLQEGVLMPKKMRKISHLCIVGQLFTALAALVFFPIGANAQIQCSEALNIQIPDTTIESAVQVKASGSVPTYCKVEGCVQTKGVSGEPDNRVNFIVGLPIAWNGKFYFQGIGWLAGSIPPIDFGLARGYASAATDTGHQADPLDADWAYNNRTKEIDFGYRAIHVVTIAGKAIASAFYGKEPAFSYFNGCSNGGRQGLIEADRYPADFDGIVAGSPVTDHMGFTMAFNWNARTLLSSRDHFIPKSKLQLIADATLESCDNKDGLSDGLISNPAACDFDPASLQCKEGDGPDCLSAGQVESLRKIYAGPATSKGRQLYPGIPKGHENAGGWEPWIVSFEESPILQTDGTLLFAGQQYGFAMQEGILRYLSFPRDNPDYDWRSFNFDKDFHQMAEMASILNVGANLSSFRNRGGKMIMYHGCSDTCLSPFHTIDYFKQVQRETGGEERTSDFLRFYLVPGMLHCAGGPGPNVFDAFGALEGWVEGGNAPGSMIASGGTPNRTRPLCPYPQIAVFNKACGNIDSAACFQCREP